MPERSLEAQAQSYSIHRLLTRNISSRVLRIFQRFLQTAEAPPPLMSIEERLAVGPKKSLVLIACSGRRFLLATAGDSITAPVEVRPLPEVDPSTRVAVIGYLGDRL